MTDSNGSDKRMTDILGLEHYSELFLFYTFCTIKVTNENDLINTNTIPTEKINETSKTNKDDLINVNIIPYDKLLEIYINSLKITQVLCFKFTKIGKKQAKFMKKFINSKSKSKI